MLKTIAAAALAAATLATPAAAVTAVDATSIYITNALSTWLQVAEVQAFSFGATNVAAAANGGTASTTGGSYNSFASADKAIDGNTGGGYYTDTIFHPDTDASDRYLLIEFAAPTTLASLNIFGRTDCCSTRDLYHVVVRSGEATLYEGDVDARGQTGTVVFDAPAAVVPEAATWVMMIAGFGLVGTSLRRRVVATA